MKVLVAYVSWTGNTKKIAEAIFSEIKVSKELKKIEEIEDIKAYDVIFLGFPVHGFGQMPEEVKTFLDEHCLGVKIAFFITHAAPEDSDFVQKWIYKFKEYASKSAILGFFNCQGQISKDELAVMLKSPDKQAREIGEKVALSSKGKPDAASLSRARGFALQIMQKL